MKARILVIIAAAALLATACRPIHRQIKDLLTYPTTAEDVAERAMRQGSDAALVVTVADTQCVLYREKEAMYDGIQRCFAMRYVKTDVCSHSWSGRGGTFRLDEPEQPVVLNRTADNALTLTVDSLVIDISDIVSTDSMLTFCFGLDEPDREATLYLYGTARKSRDVFAETSIQQMLVLALSIDCLIADTDEQVDEALDEAREALVEAETALDEELDVLATDDGSNECNARFGRMDSAAHKLGFASTEIRHRPGHRGCSLKASQGSNGLGGGKKCRQRMDQMQKLAAQEHMACTVTTEQRHQGCTFECHN